MPLKPIKSQLDPMFNSTFIPRSSQAEDAGGREQTHAADGRVERKASESQSH